MAVSKTSQTASFQTASSQPKSSQPAQVGSAVSKTIDQQPAPSRAPLSEASKPLPHLQELSRDPAFVVAPGLAFEHNESEESEYEQASYIGQVLGSCKSWLTSMVIHLAVILALAALTMRSGVNQTVFLEMGTDDFSAMTDMDELEFDSADFQTFDQADEIPERIVSTELMEYQPETELPEFDDAPMDFDNPLSSESNQLKRLTRQMTAEELLVGDGESSFFGIQATGDSIIYIVDRSGSMGGDRWRDATNELLKSINSLKPDQRFYVFLFSNKCHPMPQMEGRNKLVAPTPENKERFKKWLSRQAPDDSTKPLSSIKRAFKMEADTIFLLTDGQFYDRTVNYLDNYVRRQARGSEPDDFAINTIAFYCQEELEIMLEHIAMSFNGTFRSVQ